MPSEGAGPSRPVTLWPAAGLGQARLHPTTLDIWCVATELPSEVLGELWRVLGPEEQARAERFLVAEARNRFIAARARLRQLLGAYLDEPPESLRFRYSSKGKPALEGAAEDVDFNLAHSGGLALIAVRRGGPVGVDLELIRAGIDVEAVAERFFSARERAALLALPAGERQAAFFRCWSRKEALLKAWGEGLPFGLDLFSVSIGVSEPVRLEAPFAPAEAGRWTVRHLEPASGYVGALAVRGQAASLRCLAWREG